MGGRSPTGPQNQTGQQQQQEHEQQRGGVVVRGAGKSLCDGSTVGSPRTCTSVLRNGKGDGEGEVTGVSYLMHESIKHIAEEMATRSSPSFAPKPDDFTSFALELEEEKQMERNINPSDTRHWLSSAANYLFRSPTSVTCSGDSSAECRDEDGMSDHRFHELMASSLTAVGCDGDCDGEGTGIGGGGRGGRGSSNSRDADDNRGAGLFSSMFQEERRTSPTNISVPKPLNPIDNFRPQRGLQVKKYVATYLPFHLIHAKMLVDGSKLLIDGAFVRCRITALGSIEATRRQVADVLDLRTEHERRVGGAGDLELQNVPGANRGVQENNKGAANDNCQYSTGDTLDIDSIQQQSSQLIIDAVFQAERNLNSNDNNKSDEKSRNNNNNNNKNSNNSNKNKNNETVNMAICLCTVGEGFLKSRQNRDAVGRLEEAIQIYDRLGTAYRLDVATVLTSLAKVYARFDDRRVALSKLVEAGAIYQKCRATTYHNAIANSQLMAYLLIENGEWDKAMVQYNHIVTARMSVYGPHSLPVAKTVNDFAVVLAKHGKLSEALQQYETSRGIYEVLSSEEHFDNNNSTNNNNNKTNINNNTNNNNSRFSFDVTLLDLNIASIKTKIGDYPSALQSYERGVTGLRQALARESINSPPPINTTTPINTDTTRLTAQRRHLISAIGRIGSLKMKLRDNDGALSAYLTLLEEVTKSSPTPSQMEKAKAHVKCATIFRQMGSLEGNGSAVKHLKQAFHMYTHLHGSGHKDTKAIASSLRQWQRMDAEMGGGGG